MSSKHLDDVINELSKEFIKVETPEFVDLEKQKEREFFFGKPSATPVTGECTSCGNTMRIHLSTFICDRCEHWRSKRTLE